MGACGSSGKAGKESDERDEEPASKPAAKENPPPKQTPPPEEPKKTEEPKKAEPKPAPKVEEPKKPAPEEDDDSLEEMIQEGLHKKYELGKEIGRGGFSVVVEAWKLDTREKFAVKCIKKSMVEGEDIVLLKREIKIMKKIDHPNILKLYEVFEEEDDFYLVMELVDGKELFDKIVDRGNYSERDASNIVRQIVHAIDYLHDHDIAHRDLKPENLLSAGEKDQEVIKIADFGFSKQFKDDQLVTSCGSPGYVAPEVLTQDQYDKSVDMWSLGVIIYILLCGFPPFYADTPPELFKKIMEVKYDFDDPAWDGVTEQAKELIRSLLKKDPQERMTAKQCLKHPWVQGEGEVASKGKKALPRTTSQKIQNGFITNKDGTKK